MTAQSAAAEPLAPQGHLDQTQGVEPRLPERLFALKDDDVFLVSDASGDIHGAADGLFHNDTRLLSRFALLLGGQPPSLLSAAVSQDNVFFTAHGTNRPLAPTGRAHTPEGVVHVERKRFLCDGRLFERITFVNYGETVAHLPVALRYDADFLDMFEVRGHERPQRGKRHAPEFGPRSIAFRYEGLDGVARRSVIAFSGRPERLTATDAVFDVPVEAGGRAQFYLEVGPPAEEPPGEKRFQRAAAQARLNMRRRLRRGARVDTSGRLFNAWLERSRSDLALLVSDLPTGPYPYAGIPWFSTKFGRDALITAWQMLWLDPGLARGVLAFLAAHQARETSAFQDAEPGKILHEVRRGEMAVCGEVPFGLYYGGVDSTCLFVALAAAYAERTGDLDFIGALWPQLQAAVGWMDAFAGPDGDGLITYARAAESGLVNQGWKDSHDSVFHADGRFPKGPVALVEVQGYAFAGYKGMAGLAERRGESELAARWLARAEKIRQAVETRYWMEDAQFYAIAIDGDGEPCRVRASNAGHLLFVGLPGRDRGQAVARQLAGRAFASGWGVRTLASGQARYNPMSYHNGSVWPHDTALCAVGLRRYGEAEAVLNVLSAVFEAAVHFDNRLPELFCGFARAQGEPPVAYPVACMPQAWAAGSAFAILQACLGVRIDGWRGQIHVEVPRLPVGIGELTLHGLPLGGERLDLTFKDVGGRVVVMPGPGSTASVPLITHT